MPRLRTVFMGTPAIAVPALRALAAATEVTTVVTQPDRPAGRGHQLQEPPVKQAARALGLPVWQPERLRAQEEDPRLRCDLAVVMAYGELLREPVLTAPVHGAINLHASLLPRWRGASPLQAALRAGDAETGITVMRMVRALDAGPIYTQEVVPIPPGMTLPALHDALGAAAARALAAFLAAWPPPLPRPQDDAAATVCRKLTSEDGRLDWTQPRLALERWVRAYTPAPGCWSMALEQDESAVRWRILALQPGEADAGTAPGTVRYRAGELEVACGDGWVILAQVQLPGGTAQAGAAYARGHRPPRAFR